MLEDFERQSTIQDYCLRKKIWILTNVYMNDNSGLDYPTLAGALLVLIFVYLLFVWLWSSLKCDIFLTKMTKVQIYLNIITYCTVHVQLFKQQSAITEGYFILIWKFLLSKEAA